MSTTEIVYKDIAPGAEEDASVTTASAAGFSHPELLPFSGPIGRSMSLELDQWGLDGTFFPVEDQETIGFWSVQLSGADGSFQDPPVIDVSFGEQYSAMGLTIDFDTATGDHPTRVNVRWYQQGALKAGAVFMPDRPSYFCRQKVTSFDRIVITVLNTFLPYQYVRIERLIFGVIRRFDVGELRKATIVNELDPVAAALPVSKLTWTLDSREDTDYLFQMKQPVEVVNDSRLLGVYYIDGSSRAARSMYDISCYDAIGVLGEIPFPDGVYQNRSALELAEEIVGGYFTLDVQVPDVTVSGILKKESRRSALQQLLFAWGACAATDGRTSIRVFRPGDIAEALGPERVFHGGKVSTASIVTEVQVAAHTYTVDEEGSVEVNGVKYRDDRTVVTLKNPDVTATDKANIHKVENATLISPANAQAAAQRVYDDCARRVTVDASILWDGERLGDVLTVPNPWGGSTTGTLTKMTIKLSNTVVAGSVMRGGEEMSFLDKLVFDRSQSDVDEWLGLRRKGWAAMTEGERAHWLDGMRGAYNAVDLNRVIEALQYLSRLSQGMGESVEIVLPDIVDTSSGTPVVRGRWQVGDIPNQAQLLLYLEAIKTFWAAKERAEVAVAPVWDPLGYGYINLEDSVAVGDFVELLDLHGLLVLRVVLTSPGLAWLDLSAPGWTVREDESTAVADFVYPQGPYEDAQRALDSLILSCTERGVEKVEEVSVQVRVVLRSGAEKIFGSCVVRWSSVISWGAFDGYGFTWRDIEDRALTWVALESLPLPEREVVG